MEDISKGYLSCHKWYLKGKGLNFREEPPSKQVCAVHPGGGGGGGTALRKIIESLQLSFEHFFIKLSYIEH